jgi:hypothetical protein
MKDFQTRYDRGVYTIFLYDTLYIIVPTEMKQNITVHALTKMLL